MALLLDSKSPAIQMKPLLTALLISDLGRHFPRFLGNFIDIFFFTRLRTGHLLYQDTPQQVETSTARLLTPKCQCLCRRLPRISLGPRKGRRPRATIELRGRQVRVPEWVAYSVHDFTDEMIGVRSLRGLHSDSANWAEGIRAQEAQTKWNVRFQLRRTAGSSSTPCFLQGHGSTYACQKYIFILGMIL